MKVKQKSIRAFEFTIASAEDEAEFRGYIAQNLEILASFLISVEGEVSKETVDFLSANGLKFVIASGTLHTRPSAAAPVQPAAEESDVRIDILETKGILHYKQPIRSGSELECDDDIVIFGRINSGAKVIAKKKCYNLLQNRRSRGSLGRLPDR